jgi:hypothetical protein
VRYIQRYGRMLLDIDITDFDERILERRSSFSRSLSPSSKLPALRMASSSPRPRIAVEMAVVAVEGLAERPDFVG